MNLTDPLHKHIRITKKHAPGLKRLRIETVGDLLYHFPVRYSNVSQTKVVRELESLENTSVTVYGRISRLETKKGFKSGKAMGTGLLTDLNGDTIKVIWFHQPYMAKKFSNDEAVKLTGMVSNGKYGLTLTNPEIEHAPDMPIDSHNSLFKSNKKVKTETFGYPIYRETRGVTSKWMYHAILKILKSGILESDQIIFGDPIPDHILHKYSLPSLQTALVWIHMPRNESDAKSAEKRFAFEEIFTLQVSKQLNRKEFESRYAHNIAISQDELKEFTDTYPFTLTDAQQHVIETVRKDLEKKVPMSRLIEGDVGSGKTAVGAAICHAVVSNRPGKQTYGNLQVAYMAPTEVLASQLFENFIKYFHHTGIQIALVTGSGCKKFPSKIDPTTWTSISKNQVLKWIKHGEIPIVIGTHALLSDKVEFKDLALALIDEQHRFGTKQRAKLAQKQTTAPHYLSMTATPIPRTLALTIYGDLDLSVIDHMPPGRKPVITEIIPNNNKERDEIYTFITNQLNEGRQAYVICPRISSPDADQPLTESQWNELSPAKRNALRMKSVVQEADRLRNDIFPNQRIDIIHSKMKKDEKEKVMQKFADHEIDILVATSVIEVGVSVPNATMIIIEGAERYGLAQLHQLRGRVIRGTHQAYCWLVSDIKSDKTRERLTALKNAKNGFELAEMDLIIRGTGDLAGVKQWGISDLAMNALKNIKMVEFAREEAKSLVKEDVHLENYPSLKKRVGSITDLHFE